MKKRISGLIVIIIGFIMALAICASWYFVVAALFNDSVHIVVRLIGIIYTSMGVFGVLGANLLIIYGLLKHIEELER